MGISDLRYPKTREVEVIDTTGGVTYRDPFQWLEEDSPETRDWQTAQDALTQEYLHGWPHYDIVEQQLSGAMPPVVLPGPTAPPTPTPCGDRWLLVAPRPGALPRLISVPNLEVLTQLAKMMFAGPGGPPAVDPAIFAQIEEVFDPALVADDEPSWIQFVVPSPAGRLVALGLSKGAGQPTVLRYLDVTTKLLLPQKISLNAVFGVSPVAWLPDSSGLFYLAGSAGGPRWGPRHVFFHRPGAALPEEPELIIDECAQVAIDVSADGRYVSVLYGSAPRAEYVRDLQAAGPWMPFLSDVDGRCTGVFVGDRYVAVTTEGAPRGKVVSIPIETAADHSTWTELVPESPDRVASAMSVVDDLIVLGMANDCDLHLEVYSLEGAPIGTIPFGPGVVFPLARNLVTPCPDGFLFSSFTRTAMPSVHRFDRATGTTEPVIPPVRDVGALTERRVLAQGPDGVQIPIHLVHRPDLDTSKPNPVWLTGYGILGSIQFKPVIDSLPFLDAGGIYAWATIRGGGEFGAEWWSEGRQQNVPNTHTDFITAAEYLLERGIAAPGRLGDC